MIVNVLFKKPILTVGILMVVALYLDQKTKGKWIFARDKLMPTSCRAVAGVVSKKVPNNWEVSCENNQQNLVLHIKQIKELTPEQLRPYLYRDLANDLIYAAKVSPPETLGRVPVVRFKYEHPKLVIDGLIQGENLAKLKNLTTQEHIQQHFQASVKIKETSK